MPPNLRPSPPPQHLVLTPRPSICTVGVTVNPTCLEQKKSPLSQNLAISWGFPFLTPPWGQIIFLDFLAIFSCFWTLGVG